MQEIGPIFWYLIHIRSLDVRNSYPDHEKYREYKSFVMNILESIPCPVCRNDSLEILKDYPMPEYNPIDINDDLMTVRNDIGDYPMFIWSYNYHNMITFKINGMSKELPSLASMFIYWMNKHEITKG